MKKLKLKWKIVFSILIIIIMTFLYMRFVATSGIKVREYKVINKNTSSFYGFKIVHFSDLHYGMTVDDKKLEKLVSMINNIKPDIVVFTGDLIDRNTNITEDNNKTITKLLSKIKTTYGKYYVTGNHDKINTSYDSIMQNSNFKSLDNGYDVLYFENNKNIFISGVSVDNNISNSITDELNKNEYTYKIFLIHYPDEIDKILNYNFDLILSGHSHNGQVRVPVVGKIITPKNAKKYYDPYYKINNTDIYISGGVGNSTINLRLNNKPSFNLYRLVDK